MSLTQKSIQKIVDNQDLTRDETKAIFMEIMTGNVEEATIAAWITALRMKGETSEELAACIDIMREKAFTIDCKDKDAVDVVGTGGDGAHTINISTTAAIVAAGAGVTVAKHGNRAVSSKSGSADVLSALGVDLTMTPQDMENKLNAIGFSFLFAPQLHPAMKYAIGPRRAIGIRTTFNLLGPMSNPAGVRRNVIGVFNEHYCRVLAEAASKTENDHSLFIHGSDGLDEMTLTGTSLVLEVKGHDVTEYVFDPKKYGFDYCSLEDIAGGTPEENAAITKAILAGTEAGPKRDIVILNAAATILVSGKESSWEAAIESAKTSIASGNAAKILADYVAK